ncbi:MFS transporter [Pseudonocardia spinosispora]|uniref:MFS transporter n=1 Tax=Pseudonocardia spinosispora TaxID=103441 RepID=UPI00040588B6|nr:MFS transporter [Pseudonocardia spinosispora]
MLGLSVLAFGGYSLLLSVVPLWAARGGAGAAGSGASTGVFMLLTVLTQLVVPWLLNRVGHGWVLVVGMVLMGAPTPGLALSPELVPVLLISAVRGIGFGLLTVSGSALVAELVTPAEHGRASARYGLAIGLPQLFLLPVGVALVERVGFSAVLIAGASPLLGLLVMPFLRVPAPSATAPVLAPDELVPAGSWVRAAVPPVLALTSCSLAQGGVVTFVPLAAAGPGVAVPIALFGMSGGAVLGRLLCGELVDRRGLGGRLLRPGVLCVLAGMLVVMFAAGQPGGLAGTAQALGAVLVGVGFGLVQNDSMVTLFAAAGRRRYGTASAWWNIAYDGGTGIGAVGLGVVAELAGYRAAFGTSALILLLTATLALRPRRPQS